MPIEIKKTYFVSPRDALQIVGKASFGSDWVRDCVDDPESDLRRRALGNLRAALMSGQVTAFWHDFDYEREITPTDAAGEFFRINLRDNCVHLSFFGGKPLECRIHADQLEVFIKSEGANSPKLTVGISSACLKWLRETMSDKQSVPTRKVLWDMAQKKYPRLPRATFDRTRQRAIRDTGRSDLTKPGRRKSKI